MTASSHGTTSRRRHASRALGAALALSGLASLACAGPHAPVRTGASGAEEAPARLLDELGSHHHEITTSSPLAQRWFDQGLRLAYAFNHDEARIAFYEAAREDPACAMCWWGVAYTLGPNYNLPGDPERDREAWQAVQKAKAAAAGATERERDYVEAIAARYAAEPPADRRPLDEAWALAMGRLADRHPDDLDAQTLHAESLMDLQPWDLWTASGEPKGRTAEIVRRLESVLARDPQHPGANHYYIHAVEASRAPERAEPAADRLRDQRLGAGAGHLVHMPSHIYVRTGRYADATEANARAVAVDEAYIAKWNVQGVYPMMYYPHNVHFRSFAAAMEGRSAEAIESARKVADAITPEMVRGMAMLEGIDVAPWFVRVRFGRWEEVMAEPEPPAGQRYATGLRHWARGLAFVAQARLSDAEVESRALEALRASQPEEVLVTQVNTGKRLLGIASNHLAGELAAARGRTAEAVRRLEAAVELEDGAVYMEPPDWFVPIRPFLGAVLLGAGRVREAEAVYREDLRRNPENGWALHGLAESLARGGRDEEAAAVRARLAKAWARADAAPTLGLATLQGVADADVGGAERAGRPTR